MKKQFRNICFILVLILGAIKLKMSFAAAPINLNEKRGLEISRMVEKANKGFVGESSIMKMLLISAHGEVITRNLLGKITEVPGDGEKSLSIFKTPLDVQGTKMLTWSHKDRNDDQWLYLPALRRVKRISSSGKTASFMGSEFSYEDLGSQEVEKYKHLFIRKILNEKNNITWIIEKRPLLKSGYSKIKVWIDKNTMNPSKMEYYDRKEKLLKIAMFQDYKTYKTKGKTFFRPAFIHMTNVQTKKQSKMIWEQRALGISFPADEYETHNLK